MKLIRLTCILMIPAMLLSCSKSDDTITPQPKIQPTLSSIQQQVFDVSCSSTSCHGSSAAGGLILTTGSSYSQLVGVRSVRDGEHTPTFFRVQPNSPDSSFLYIKLTAPTSKQGTLMPRLGVKLSQDKIDAIQTWIASGANQN